jgi:VIT1/CCC1 family predicted Fe2+/Mn2+ transporter
VNQISRLFDANVQVDALNLESFEKTLHGGAFGLTESTILVLSLLLGIGRATQNLRLTLLVGVTGVIANSIAASFGHLVEGFTEREEQRHRRRHDRVQTEIMSNSEIIGNMVSCLVMSTFAAVLPILPFYIFSIEVAMTGSMVIGVGMAFSMGYLAGKLGEEKNPLLIGVLYAVIVIVGTETSYFLVNLIEMI